jgi:hypothetical protein
VEELVALVIEAPPEKGPVNRFGLHRATLSRLSIGKQWMVDQLPSSVWIELPKSFVSHR